MHHKTVVALTPRSAHITSIIELSRGPAADDRHLLCRFTSRSISEQQGIGNRGSATGLKRSRELLHV